MTRSLSKDTIFDVRLASETDIEQANLPRSRKNPWDKKFVKQDEKFEQALKELPINTAIVVEMRGPYVHWEGREYFSDITIRMRYRGVSIQAAKLPEENPSEDVFRFLIRKTSA